MYTGFWFRFSPGFTYNPIATKILYQYGSINSTATGWLTYMRCGQRIAGTVVRDVEIGIQGNGTAGYLSKSLPHTREKTKYLRV